MTLPNFIIVGAMKSGTTTLKEYLRTHDDIFMPPKEIHFFNKNSNYTRGIEWYEKFFEGASGQTAIGEKTPNYCYIDHVPERIHHHLPQTRLIWILRDPVARAYSHYWHAARNGKELLEFETSIDHELAGTRQQENQYRLYLARGQYADQIKNYLRFFPQDQMLFLLFEELVRDPEPSLHRACSFLGVNPNLKVGKTLKRANVGYKPRSLYFNWITRQFLGDVRFKNWKRLRQGRARKSSYPPLNEQTRTLLKEYFREHNLALAELIGVDVSMWE